MPGDVNSPKKDSPYFDPYWESIRAMQENDNFLEGVLLRSVDCKRESCDWSTRLMDLLVGGRMDGRWMDGWIDGWTDGRMEEWVMGR